MSTYSVRNEVIAVGNPYMPGGNHGQDKAKAMAHFRALEMAAHKEG